MRAFPTFSVLCWTRFPSLSSWSMFFLQPKHLPGSKTTVQQNYLEPVDMLMAGAVRLIFPDAWGREAVWLLEIHESPPSLKRFGAAAQMLKLEALHSKLHFHAFMSFSPVFLVITKVRSDLDFPSFFFPKYFIGTSDWKSFYPTSIMVKKIIKNPNVLQR